MNKTLEELLNEMRQIGTFNGIFDAKHGSWEFMHGVAAVMTYLAQEVSVEYAEEFDKEFWENFQRSLDKASRK